MWTVFKRQTGDIAGQTLLRQQGKLLSECHNLFLSSTSWSRPFSSFCGWNQHQIHHVFLVSCCLYSVSTLKLSLVGVFSADYGNLVFCDSLLRLIVSASGDYCIVLQQSLKMQCANAWQQSSWWNFVFRFLEEKKAGRFGTFFQFLKVFSVWLSVVLACRPDPVLNVRITILIKQIRLMSAALIIVWL